MSFELLIFLILFQIKHIVADYYLQFPHMYENKGKKEGWFYPLLEHSSVHACGTAIIIGIHIVMNPMKYTLEEATTLYLFAILFDLLTHFITDRWKATRKTDPSQSWFWKSLGIDQMIHHTVGILIVCYMFQ